MIIRLATLRSHAGESPPSRLSLRVSRLEPTTGPQSHADSVTTRCTTPCQTPIPAAISRTLAVGVFLDRREAQPGALPPNALPFPTLSTLARLRRFPVTALPGRELITVHGVGRAAGVNWEIVAPSRPRSARCHNGKLVERPDDHHQEATSKLHPQILTYYSAVATSWSVWNFRAGC